MPAQNTTQQQRNQNNMQRNEAILGGQESLRVLRQTLQLHKREWKQHFVQTALQRIGAEAWFHLTTKEQKMKANLLAVLCKHDKLPYSLCGGAFWANTQLKDDKDLLLARLQRPHFVRELGLTPFALPESLKGDLEVVLAAVRVYPQVLTDLEHDKKAESYWDDPRVLRALFEAEDRREPYLRMFSVKLRSDCNLMLEALRHGIRVFEVITKQLRNSRPFALKAAAIMASSSFHFGTKCLRSFSPRLKSDLEVVRAFCQCDGTSLACASYPARRNREIVRMACQQEPTALVYCLKGSTRTKLIQDKAFWIEILQQAQVRCECPFAIVGDKLVMDERIELWDRLWENMPLHLREDPEIALLMLQKAPSSCSYFDKLSLSLLVDQAFLIEVAALGRLQALPVAELMERGLLQNMDLDFWCKIVSNELVCPDVIQTLVDQFPFASSSHRRFWEAFNPCQFVDTLDFIFDEMPDDIVNDKEIMLKFATCERSAFHLTNILWETRLAEDRDILSNLLSTHPEALAPLPNYIQEVHPDLVAKCIEDIHSDSFLMECLHDAIYEELWSNRDVALAWIRKGGEDLFFLDEYFSDDEEIFLAVAEHNWEEFYMVSESLLTDTCFLIKAVARNGKVWTMLEADMKEEFGIALAAFAANPNLPYYSADEDFLFLTTFARKVRNELEIHDSFVQLVLCSMDLPSSTNILAKLNQGRHTALQYKKIIAECIGLPMGDYLLQLRNASENLAVWGF